MHLILPELKLWSELFSLTLHREATRPDPVRVGSLRIGPTCSISTKGKGYTYGWVVPTEAVVDALTVGPRGLVVDDDDIYFKVIERDDGSVLVVATHNKIIGSRWLTEFPSLDYVPTEVFQDFPSSQQGDGADG